MQSYSSWFQEVTGFAPYPYQERLAHGELPGVLEVPTGLGKTAAVSLAWLWRRRLADDEVRRRTPRRLVYALPMRTLVEQTATNLRRWIEAAGFADLPVHLLLGGAVDREWDRDPTADAVLVGTQDMLLSRALNRGYAESRYRWPVQMGLLHSDVLWVLDEVQLMGAGLPTTTQLQALRRTFHTLGPAHTLWMSATLQPDWLRSVDVTDEDLGEHHTLTDADRAHGQVEQRLTAVKPLTRAQGDRAISILQSHRPGSLTLVVVNTVKRAQVLFDALRKQQPSARLVLLHSRFRQDDRAVALAALLADPDEHGTIAVATQVVEAGVDISALTMLTELAPWSSLVQRFGRCNRAGGQPDARVLWFDLDVKREAAPYAADDLVRARELLEGLADVGLASLPPVSEAPPPTLVLRRRDLLDLFDTTPDLAGADVDVSRFIRETDDHQVRVFWRALDGDPPADLPAPRREELCPAPVGEFSERRAWAWDALGRSWRHADDVRPGQVLLLHPSDGGYSAERGWTGKKTHKPTPLAQTAGAPPEADDVDRYPNVRTTLVEHTDAVVEALDRMLARLDLPSHLEAALRVAARWHDAGKTHPVFQDAMKAHDPDAGAALLAKPGAAPAHYTRRGFRHELASGLACLEHGHPDLVAYLAVAHHGKVRLSIRSLPHEHGDPKQPQRRFARGIWDGDVLPEADLGGGVTLPQTTLSLAPMELGRGDHGVSWLSRSLRLLDELGPFRLAYLEALLRTADWGASQMAESSGGDPSASEEVTHA